MRFWSNAFHDTRNNGDESCGCGNVGDVGDVNDDIDVEEVSKRIVECSNPRRSNTRTLPSAPTDVKM